MKILLPFLFVSFVAQAQKIPNEDRPYEDLFFFEETARYKKESSCSSRLIKSAEATAQVISDRTTEVLVRLDYKFKLRVGGKKSGSEEMWLDIAYFQEDFYDRLRVNGRYEDDLVRIDHVGSNFDCDDIAIDLKGEDLKLKATRCFGEPLLGITKISTKVKKSGISAKICLRLDS